MIAALNDEYPNKDHMIATLIKTFAIINDLDLPPDSMWFRKSNFFTLVVEISKHQTDIKANLKKCLINLEEHVMDAKYNKNSDYAKYYSYMYQATHGRTARVVRGEFFEKECI